MSCRNAEIVRKKKKDVEEEGVECEICFKNFDNATVLSSHVKSDHQRSFMQCPHCPDDKTEYENKRSLFEHIKKKKCNPDHDDAHFEFPNCRFVNCIFPECQNKEIKLNHLSNHISLSHPNTKCLLCSVKFESNEDLTNHYVKNHLKIYYKCVVPNCDKSAQIYSSRCSLLTHQSLRHFGRRQRCPYCGIVEACFKKIAFHIEEAHKGVVQTACTCEICGKVFKDNRSLNTHRNIYHRQGESKCKKCNLTFTNGLEHFDHSRKVHKSNSRGKEIPCATCGKVVFSSKMRFHFIAEHLTNDDVKCYLCETKSNHIFSLQKHIKRHHKDQNPSVSYLLEKYNLTDKIIF